MPPHVLYGVKYIGLVSHAPFKTAVGQSRTHCSPARLRLKMPPSNVDLSRAPYVLYEVKYTSSYRSLHSFQTKHCDYSHAHIMSIAPPTLLNNGAQKAGGFETCV